MIISMIAAMGKNRVIGKDNKMMWHLPLEYKYFKEVTMGHCIISGRKNFEAQGRPLPGRVNIVITRNSGLKIDGCVVVQSLQEALDYAKEHGETEAFVTGGGQIYKQALTFANKIYLTEVDFEAEGEVFFPKFDESNYNKTLMRSQVVTEKNNLAWNAFLFEKRTAQ
jgi:dihydrofolate reductase